MYTLDKLGHISSQEKIAKSYFQIRDNWEGKGYRLYYGDDRYVSQVDGEINGRVFRTIREAKAYCENRFGETAVRSFD